MLNYIILVNKRKECIVIDYETDRKNCVPGTGYIEEFEDWRSNKEEYLNSDDFSFSYEKAFKEVGIYKVFGYDEMYNTPDGDCYYYNVENIKKIQDLKYELKCGG